jgi:hypothetical protein
VQHRIQERCAEGDGHKVPLLPIASLCIVAGTVS